MTTVYTWQTDTSGVHWFRTLLPYSVLDRARFQASYGPPHPGMHDYDVVVGQRVAGPDHRWQAICADPNTLAVYDIDDDLTAIDPENTVPYAIYHPLADGTRDNIRAADVVTVPTQAFADRMRALNPHVVVLPICIPDDMPDYPDRRNPATLTVGWAGSMFKAQDWGGINAALTWYTSWNPGAEVHLMGADYTGGALGGRARFTGWSTVEDYYRGLDFHIGLAPLADTYFNAGKSRTKAVEYGSRGVPTVGSAVGEQATWIEHGVNGFLVEPGHPEQWIEHLTTLTDPGVREACGAAARVKARQATISRNIHRWEAVYSGHWEPS